MRDWRTVQLSASLDIWCLVDAIDYDWICQHCWHHIWHRQSPNRLYARRNVGSSRETIYLHREIMQLAKPRPFTYTSRRVVDHLNGNSLDNRRANLRWATHRQNRLNRYAIVPTLEEIIATLPTDPELPF